MKFEKRAYMHAPELRAADDGKTLRGYAAVFDSETEIAGQFREVIRKGAFSRSIKSDVRALVDHDPARVIGRTKAGTLRLNQDERGLAVEIDLPNTSDGRDLAELVKRGDIDGMSFGFRVESEIWDMTEESQLDLREIMDLELFEVSAVTFPAYGDTELALRSRDKAKEETQKDEREAEKARDMRLMRIAQKQAEQEQKFRRI